MLWMRDFSFSNTNKYRRGGIYRARNDGDLLAAKALSKHNRTAEEKTSPSQERAGSPVKATAWDEV
jgi:hypothetical protein